MIKKGRLNTPFVNNLKQKIRITHPFHPLYNQQFDLVAYRKSWRREYVDVERGLDRPKKNRLKKDDA